MKEYLIKLEKEQKVVIPINNKWCIVSKQTKEVIFEREKKIDLLDYSLRKDIFA